MYFNFARIFPSRVSYDYGVFYLQDLVQWVPKLLWPARPDFRAAKREEVLSEIGTCHVCGPTPTMLGMYWMHGGFAPVFIMSAFTGLFFGFFDAFGKSGNFTAQLPTAVCLSIIGMAAGTPISLGPLAILSIWGPFVALPLFGLLLFGTVHNRTFQRRPFTIKISADQASERYRNAKSGYLT